MSKLDEFTEAGERSAFEANRLLFKWLSDDQERADLYQALSKDGGVLKFQSRADFRERPTDEARFHQDVYLLAEPKLVRDALSKSEIYSNAPYKALGSGTFMLGLDEDRNNPDDDHRKQHEFAAKCLQVDAPIITALARVAFLAAAILPLKQREFDLVDLAEQAALRFVGFLFGYAQSDHPLLEAAMRKAYHGLNYQIVGRHFDSEPLTLQETAGGMGALLQKTAYLLGLYSRVGHVSHEQELESKRLAIELAELCNFEDPKNTKPLSKFVPVLKRMAQEGSASYSGNELAVIVVGLIAGTVGNIQASVAIAIREFFREAKVFDRARELGQQAQLGDDASAATLQTLIWEALRLNPPAAFLPRKLRKDELLYSFNAKEGSIVLLCIGAATRNESGDGNEFRQDREEEHPLIFGGGDGSFLHRCVGTHLAMPVIAHVVSKVVALPGLAERLDPTTGEPFPLEKLWGIICQKYPLQYKRESLLKQSPLIVVMSVKTPVAEHAEKLKKVIQYGAPRIEKKLSESRHVHFAQFLFVENDTKLILFTIYDRDFDSYIEHFALAIGPLFDRIFEHIQDAPPLPVDKFPKEFVDTIRRYNVRPAADYFFSAYPGAEAAKITDQFTKKLS